MRSPFAALRRRYALAAAGALSLTPASADAKANETAWTLAEASRAMADGKTSAVALTKACLARIARYEKALNAFITVTADAALAQARQLDQEWAEGRRRGPLHGIPITFKDNIDTAGVRTTAASALFLDRVPSEDADVVRRLKDAGVVILGKLNMDEFAHGSHSAVTYFGPVHNPWDLKRVPGGSSGGSAAAVAAGLCYAALGTDTAGSVRAPATLCGVVGLRPTYGRISNRGVVPAAWTLDTVGPLCRTVEDTALMLQAMAGYDAGDIASVDVPVPDYISALNMPIGHVRIGTPRAQFFDVYDEDIAAAVEEALAHLKTMTAGTRDVSLPAIAHLVKPIQQAETMGFHAPLFSKSPELYQPAFRKTLDAAVGASAAEYASARREVARLRREIGALFETVDVIITPTRRALPATLDDVLKELRGEKTPAPFASNTVQFSILGLPAITVPCGFSRQGLPIGLQIAAAPWNEALVLALAHAYEKATTWHRRRPPLR